MSWPPFFPKFRDLPSTIPVFPLKGVLLLPHGQLPLNIFEPRYVAMTDDAIAGGRIVGMVQPRQDNGGVPPLYGTGCAGRITSFEETEDGRYLITLTGLCRFRLSEELPTTRGYRRVLADWTGFAADMQDRGMPEVAPAVAEEKRQEILATLQHYFQSTGISANWDAIRQTPCDRLVTSLAMICPFEPEEKQALLEAPDLAARARLMISMMAMTVHGCEDKARH
jgi:Lon protease-like protein